ncbi:hypothetical protein HY522_04545 [bacterium]|nr:hypothetical protein [bacterium]
MSECREGEYNGSPLLGLYRDEKDNFGLLKFGVKKARAILAHVEDIRAFVEKHDKAPARVA